MINEHVILDERNRVCLCGQYHGQVLSCSEVIRQIKNHDTGQPLDPRTYPKMLMALKTQIKNCPDD